MKQLKIKTKGQPPARWPQFMREAMQRLAVNGWKRGADAVACIGAEIVANGDGAAFLRAARRGRPTVRQNQRYQLLREVEQLEGAAVPRRREDRNTPEAMSTPANVVLMAEPERVKRPGNPGCGRKRRRPREDRTKSIAAVTGCPAGRLAA